MNIVSRLTIAAAFTAVAAVACTSVPDEPVSVGVDTDQVDTKCIKGGITCGVAGSTSGGTKGGTVGGTSGTVSTSSSSSGGTTSSGGTSGKLGDIWNGSSGTLAPADPVETCGTNPTGSTTQPPANARVGAGCDPTDCGPWCRWDAQQYGCDCSGAGYGLSSTIGCPARHPCGRYVWGTVRCYDRLESGDCAP